MKINKLKKNYYHNIYYCNWCEIMVVKIGILKIGNIGTSVLIDVILDERADREDIDVMTVSSGAKMGNSQLDEVLPKLEEYNPDLIIFISPDPGSSIPSKARDILSKQDIPTIVIGDGPGKRAIDEMKEQNLGYIIVKADSMIGARREFLDATEMAIFNSDVLMVLSATGVFRLIQETLDNVIEDINNNQAFALPEIMVTAEHAVEYANFKNPYAKSKAIAAYSIASQVSSMNIKACFKTKDSGVYLPLVCAAHEMMSTASKLAYEAREIEKSNDTVVRTAHRRNGTILHKTEL